MMRDRLHTQWGIVTVGFQIFLIGTNTKYRLAFRRLLFRAGFLGSETNA